MAPDSEGETKQEGKEAGPSANQAPLPLAGIPWEQPGTPRLAALWLTLLFSLTKPGAFYSALPAEGPPGQRAGRSWQAPLSYVAWIYGLLMLLPLAFSLFSFGSSTLRLTLTLVVTVGVFLFVYSLAAHLVLRALGAASREFIATFRVVCYASGALLFGIVPIFGGLLALGWLLVMLSLGFVMVQGASWPRALAGVVLPQLLIVLVLMFQSSLPLPLGCALPLFF